MCQNEVRAKRVVDRGACKVDVFEIAEKCDVEQDAQHENRHSRMALSLAIAQSLQGACQQKVDHYGRRDDQHIQGSPPCVEEQRCKDQPAQCPRPRTSAKCEESSKSHWNKTEDEFVGIEQHGVCSAKELGRSKNYGP